VHHGSLPAESGYTRGFALLTVAAAGAAIAATLVPSTLRARSASSKDTMPHAELGLLAGGTLAGDQSE
jgi:hypothetical protein